VPGDTVNGSGPCSFPNPGGTPDPYVAQNFGGSGGGGGTITSQTLRSSNCAYLRLAQIVGMGNVISAAQSLGVRSPLERVLSLPLGVADITPLEMANAYGTLANDGVRVEPYFVEKVVDRAGNVILEHQHTAHRSVSQQTARLATEVLGANVEQGTGTRARLPGQPAAGKTGTAQDFADAWFVGYTPYLSTAVWMGAPEGRVEMRNVGGVSGVTGGSFPARLWGAFNAAYHEGLEPRPFAPPEPTRPGTYLRTPEEQARYEAAQRAAERRAAAAAQLACAAGTAASDTTGDGIPDACVASAPSTTVAPPAPG
jgi:penicillin-binding protein 1A